MAIRICAHIFTIVDENYNLDIHCFKQIELSKLGSIKKNPLSVLPDKYCIIVKSL